MKYVGRLVLLAQTTLIAGWLNAGTVTVNGLNCGSTVGNVTISASGDITVLDSPWGSGYGYVTGLPVIGFSATQFVNGDVGGLLSNYAGSTSHKGEIYWDWD